MEIEREKEGADHGGQGHMAEEADGPHQEASDCPVILLTHFQEALNDPLSAGT